MDGYDNDLPPSEAARDRRRDRDADARTRAGMKTGLAKQFKQVLDAQAMRARDLEPPAAPASATSDGQDEPSARASRKPRSRAAAAATQPPNVKE
jgi:hypothetical protein